METDHYHYFHVGGENYHCQFNSWNFHRGQESDTLGKHNCTGKNCWHAWNEVSHIPLMIHMPGNKYAGESRSQLTQNIDIMPTILEYFNINFQNKIHGRSWFEIINNNAAIHNNVLYG